MVPNNRIIMIVVIPNPVPFAAIVAIILDIKILERRNYVTRTQDAHKQRSQKQLAWHWQF